MDLQLLEDIGFRYERIEGLIELAQTVLENCADVMGISEKALNYSLFEIRCIIGENNDELQKWIKLAYENRKKMEGVN